MNSKSKPTKKLKIILMMNYPCFILFCGTGYCVNMTMGKSWNLTFNTHLHQHPILMISVNNDNDMYFRTPCTKCTPTVEIWRMVSVIDTRKLKWFTSVSSRRKIPTPMVHTKVKLDQLHRNAISSCFRYY